MKIHDITLELHDEMPVYPGDPKFRRALAKEIADSSSSLVSHLSLGAHTGTHIDMPSHMLPGGATLDDLPLTALIGRAVMIDLSRVKGQITADHLMPLCKKRCERLIIKTKNSKIRGERRRFDIFFSSLDESAAEFIVKKGIFLVGIDAPSIDPFGAVGHPAHTRLMEAGVVILEGLNLSNIKAGKYDLFCGPMKIKGGEGAPARVFLLTH